MMGNLLILLLGLLLGTGNVSIIADGFQIRLVNETDCCSGRMEVYHSGQWGTVCDDNWDLKEAAVVCRQLGCGGAVSAPGEAKLGQGSGQIWLDDVVCSGSEASLTQCTYQPFGTHNCGHSEDAGVVCSGSIQLRLSGGSQCDGRVEVNNPGEWGSVCADSWGLREADVVCSQLQCGAAVSAYGQASVNMTLGAMDCAGSEKRLCHCVSEDLSSQACRSGEDSAVICVNSGLIVEPTLSMLPPSPVVISGDQVTFRCTAPNPLYTSLDFELYQDTVGYQHPIVTQRAESPQTTVELTVSNVEPSHQGSYRCRYRVQGSNQTFSSNHSNSINITVVNVQKPTISSSPSTGDLTKGQSFSITCRSASKHSDGKLNLLQSTGGTEVKVASQSVQVELSVNFTFPSANFSNDGNYRCEYETQVSGHTVRTTSLNTAVITVTDVRLAGGGSCAGRVEVYHSGDWGTVCEDGWGLPDADVVCRQLGCGAAVSAPGGAVYGQGSGPNLLSDVECDGGETVLSQCPSRGWRGHNCNHGKEASVICFGSGAIAEPILSLLSPSPSFTLREQITFTCTAPYALYTSIEFDWYRGAARNPIMTQKAVSPQTTMKLNVSNVDPSHQGSYSCQYRVQGSSGNISSNHSHSINITVVDLSIPQIHISEPTGHLTKGQSLNINCSTAPQYPGGTFKLLHSSLSGSQWLPATNHIAVFKIHAVTYSHDGNYSCQYSTQVSGRTFNSSVSRTESVTVTDVRLAGGGSCAGRVEVYHSGDWGTVCEDGWGLPDADVVCRQLGCGAAVSAPGGAVYGRGSGPILLSDVECDGGETVLSQCPPRGWRSHNCNHGKEASVICFGSGVIHKPLISLLSPVTALLPGENITLTCTAPTNLYASIDFDWYRSTAGHPIVTQRAESPQTTVELTVSNVDLSHQGSYSCRYRVQGSSGNISSNHSHSINITVVDLQKPRISLSDHNGEVTRGYSYVITCSTRQHFPGGTFHLLINGKVIRSANTDGSSASFSFPTADFMHAGKYSCLYDTQVSGRQFSSLESEHKSVSVRESLVKPIVTWMLIVFLICLILLILVCLVCRKRRKEQEQRARGVCVLTTYTPQAASSNEYEELAVGPGNTEVVSEKTDETQPLGEDRM
ncbi:deleted in malignant brain tumors 1 protein [Amia ocellicauda]|uniref:deleted in malignant brain tumors 1 protein n=1 Tax=Amia ocellicauda TaxID=2972642 RepID=UPI0034638A50